MPLAHFLDAFLSIFASTKFKNTKIILTGFLGNIGKLLAPQLIANGHDLTIISSDPQRKLEIEKLGTKAAIGHMQDLRFLTLINGFEGNK